MESIWLTYAKQLQAIAGSGLHFTKDHHDRERYEEIARIANEMLSAIGDTPIHRIRELVSDFAKGYATPRVDVRAAVLDQGKVLLVQEAADQLWTLPGGYADVGLSARENVEKEVLEEAGIQVEAVDLYAIRHKAKHDYDPDARDFYKLFFLCRPVTARTPSANGLETLAARYFAPDEVPPLSTGRVLAKDIESAFAASQAEQRHVVFD